MNRFELHHHHAIAFGYSCFDRMILRGTILAFQHSARSGTICWFLRTQPQAAAVDKALHNLVEHFGMAA